MSNRKPHNQDAGYIAEKIYAPSHSHIVIYVAEEQGMDVGSAKYAVVCSTHATLCGSTSLPDARKLMKHPEFCMDCMEQPAAPIAEEPNHTTEGRT